MSSAHWSVEYDDLDHEPYATPCDCPYGEDHDNGPITPAELLQHPDGLTESLL